MKSPRTSGPPRGPARQFKYCCNKSSLTSSGGSTITSSESASASDCAIASRFQHVVQTSDCALPRLPPSPPTCLLIFSRPYADNEATGKHFSSSAGGTRTTQAPSCRTSSVQTACAEFLFCGQARHLCRRSGAWASMHPWPAQQRGMVGSSSDFVCSNLLAARSSVPMSCSRSFPFIWLDG